VESYLAAFHYDLVTPDGRIQRWIDESGRSKRAVVIIEEISPAFVGYDLDAALVSFNLKSTLAQLGLHAKTGEISFTRMHACAEVVVEFIALDPLGVEMLSLLMPGDYVGKLFAADDRRRVRDSIYLSRMFGRTDRKGRPLLALGGGAGDLILEKQDGRTVAFLPLRNGVIAYEDAVTGFLPTLAKGLTKNLPMMRQLLQLHQRWEEGVSRIVRKDRILLVRTTPLHVRTVYARVVDNLLPKGYRHTSANVLQPDTTASGDIYEFYGSSHLAIEEVPLEFYTLEPHREHVFFADRDQLQAQLEDSKSLFAAFQTAPLPHNQLAAVFVVKGTQLQNLSPQEWIVRDPFKYEFPGLAHPSRQALVAEKYIEHQPAYPFLKAIEQGLITSQGILLCRHFPTPLLKRMLLNGEVQRCLQRLYFQFPSCSHDGFFSHEDRALLVDLAKFGIPTYWVDGSSGTILQYVLKPDKDVGLFVPLALVEKFRKAVVFGVYGSNLIEGGFERELKELLQGAQEIFRDTPLALLTGGGPGAMEVGNRVAKSLGILSCANIVDFRSQGGGVVNEQKVNPYIDAKMTYRLDRLVERQAEFYLDVPIFLPGGMGMDFEYSLEEVRRKTGSCPATPVLLFGAEEYWRRKVSSRFQLNRETGTIKGSEWVSNCFYCIQTAQQGLAILKQFFAGELSIGKEGPIYDEGFCVKR
jgi:predicted Rossmann-fold nucleotide-binding protein